MKRFLVFVVGLAVLCLVPITALAQTTVQSDAAGTTHPAPQVNLPVGTLVPFYYSAPTTQMDTTNDIIQLANVPIHARIVEILISCDDWDTNAAPAVTFDVGYGTADAATEDDFFSNQVVCQTGGTIKLSEDGDQSTNFRSSAFLVSGQ